MGKKKVQYQTHFAITGRMKGTSQERLYQWYDPKLPGITFAIAQNHKTRFKQDLY